MARLDNRRHTHPAICAIEVEPEQEDMSILLKELPKEGENNLTQMLAAAQAQDPEVQKFIDLIEHGELQDNEVLDRKIALQQSLCNDRWCQRERIV